MLDDLATLLLCPRCGGRPLQPAGAGLICTRCGHQAPVRGGVVHLATGLEDPAIGRERRAVWDLEANTPATKDTDFSMARLVDGPSPLRTAFLALPHDDGTAFFRDNEYFRNVSQFATTFDAVVDRLGLPPGSRVLDVGADLTWSSGRLARRGWRPVAIDINHHLAASQVFRAEGIAFPAVNVDMHAPVFADGAFDGVTAFNALHHTHRLEPLVANLARVLRPGGRLGFIEPYWFHEQTRAGFGASQIEAGINENVYRLEEWHRAFVNHGLEPVTFVAAASFHGVYEKRAETSRTLTAEDARADLFSTYYRATLTAPPHVDGDAHPGEAAVLPVTIRNRGLAGWASHSQIPVFLSYHLRQAPDRAGEAGTMLAFDNPRTAFETIYAGGEAEVPLQLIAPAEPGDYLLEIDLVHEGLTWFADRGVVPARVGLRVR